MSDQVEDFLEHYGVKGMKWGVRKERETSGGSGGSSTKKPVELSQLEKDVLKAAGDNPAQNARMRAMYGDGKGEDPKQVAIDDIKKHRLTPDQKEALKTVAIYAGVGLALYGGYKYLEKAQRDATLGEYKDSGNLQDFWKNYQKIGRKVEMTDKDLASLSTEPIKLGAGSIVKRISTSKERDIRPGGFFAAYKDEDVERYKAVLPVYWKQWGVDKGDGGQIVNLRAKTDINAPSPRQTFDLFKEFLDNGKLPDKNGKANAWSAKDYFDPTAVQRVIMGKNTPQPPTDQIAKKAFRAAALNWANNDDDGTAGFFAFVKEKGFNALPDMNDLGKLADTPLRLLDGTNFEIASHERLTKQGIRAAQEVLTKVAHAAIQLINSVKESLVLIEATDDPAADFLAHYGVKGMKWGQRKAMPNRADIRSSRREFREHAKNARGILKEAKQADKAGDPKARAAAAKRYKKEVVDKIQTDEFKKTFKNASTYTKGETAVNLILSGPFMPLTAASIRYSQSDKTLDRTHAASVGVAKEILKELQSVD